MMQDKCFQNYLQPGARPEYFDVCVHVCKCGRNIFQSILELQKESTIDWPSLIAETQPTYRNDATRNLKEELKGFDVCMIACKQG